jgi:acyl-CoA synthetase (AMP-forming)/AMP-acid ligase II
MMLRAEVMEVHFACVALHALVINVNVNLAARELRHVLADSGCTVMVVDAEGWRAGGGSPRP